MLKPGSKQLKEHETLHGLTGTIVENVSVKRKPSRPGKDQSEPSLETITYGIEWIVRYMLSSILVVYLTYDGRTELPFPHDINP